MRSVMTQGLCPMWYKYIIPCAVSGELLVLSHNSYIYQNCDLERSMLHGITYKLQTEDFKNWTNVSELQNKNVSKYTEHLRTRNIVLLYWSNSSGHFHFTYCKQRFYSVYASVIENLIGSGNI